MLLLTIGMVLLSLVLSYAWWVQVRVIALRQDIFDIRDALFDVAAESNGFLDPAYCEARRRINGVASSADIIASGPALLMIYAQLRSEEKREPIPETCNQVLGRAIEAAMRSCDERIIRYVFEDTLLGLVVRLIATVLPPIRAVGGWALRKRLDSRRAAHGEFSGGSSS